MWSHTSNNFALPSSSNLCLREWVTPNWKFYTSAFVQTRLLAVANVRVLSSSDCFTDVGQRVWVVTLNSSEHSWQSPCSTGVGDKKNLNFHFSYLCLRGWGNSSLVIWQVWLCADLVRIAWPSRRGRWFRPRADRAPRSLGLLCLKGAN